MKLLNVCSDILNLYEMYVWSASLYHVALLLRLINFSLCNRKIACLQEKSPIQVSILKTYVALVFSIYQSDLHPLVIPWFMAFRTVAHHFLWTKIIWYAQLDLQFSYYKVSLFIS